MIKCFHLIIPFLLFTADTYAEYRAYQYFVTSKYNYPTSQSTYLITSTLSPEAYVSYHGGSGLIHVDLVQTWMCYGSTNGNNICPDPTTKDMDK